MLEVNLPFPPSINTYWRQARGHIHISEKGKAYRQNVIAQIWQGQKPKTLEGRLQVSIFVYPPDKRRRDLDNILKAPLDALAHAQVYVDDEQVDSLSIKRCEVVKDGALKVIIQELPTPSKTSMGSK